MTEQMSCCVKFILALGLVISSNLKWWFKDPENQVTTSHKGKR